MVESTETGEPVPNFPIRFTWQTGLLRELIDRQVLVIKQDISRARAEGRMVVYLSCPVSGRGGGHNRTNVEIAHHTARRTTSRWGHRFWVLNPAAYQLESKEGTSLLQQHADAYGRETHTKPVDVRTLKPEGGDYMRMWTRVLVEDDGGAANGNLGGSFDAYYFLGPRDAEEFFSSTGAKTLTSGVEEYFASKFSIDPDFRADFSPTQGPPETARPDEDSWRRLRRDFFRYYTVRASAAYSRGSHDEWEILRILNKLRVRKLGIGSQIAAYWDGRALSMGEMETTVVPGYAVSSPAKA